MRIFLGLIRALFRDRSSLALENLALRQQLAILNRTVKRPKFQRGDRLFWVLLRRCWDGWDASLLIVKPDTVIRWHRQGFKAFWTWKSRRKKPGRPPLDPEVIALIKCMANCYSRCERRAARPLEQPDRNADFQPQIVIRHPHVAL